MLKYLNIRWLNISISFIFLFDVNSFYVSYLLFSIRTTKKRSDFFGTFDQRWTKMKLECARVKKGQKNWTNYFLSHVWVSFISSIYEKKNWGFPEVKYNMRRRRPLICCIKLSSPSKLTLEEPPSTQTGVFNPFSREFHRTKKKVNLIWQILHVVYFFRFCHSTWKVSP